MPPSWSDVPRPPISAFVGIEGPVALIADADGVDVSVEADEGLSRSHIAEDVSHGIDFYLIKFEFSHFFGDTVDVGFFIAAFTGVFYDVSQETGHILFVVLGCFFNFGVIYSHGTLSFYMFAF